MNATFIYDGYEQWSSTINVHSYIYEHTSCMINDYRNSYDHWLSMIIDHNWHSNRSMIVAMECCWSYMISVDQWVILWSPPLGGDGGDDVGEEKIDILTEDFLPQPSGPSACVLGLSPTCPTAWRQAVKTTVKPCLKIWMQSNNKWINEIFLVGLFQNSKMWLVYRSDFLSPGSMSEREALCSIATSTCWLKTILFGFFFQFYNRLKRPLKEMTGAWWKLRNHQNLAALAAVAALVLVAVANLRTSKVFNKNFDIFLARFNINCNISQG